MALSLKQAQLQLQATGWSVVEVNQTTNRRKYLDVRKGTRHYQIEIGGVMGHYGVFRPETYPSPAFKQVRLSDLIRFMESL